MNVSSGWLLAKVSLCPVGSQVSCAHFRINYRGLRNEILRLPRPGSHDHPWSWRLIKLHVNYLDCEWASKWLPTGCENQRKGERCLVMKATDTHEGKGDCSCPGLIKNHPSQTCLKFYILFLRAVKNCLWATAWELQTFLFHESPSLPTYHFPHRKGNRSSQGHTDVKWKSPHCRPGLLDSNSCVLSHGLLVQPAKIHHLPKTSTVGKEGWLHLDLLKLMLA